MRTLVNVFFLSIIYNISVGQTVSEKLDQYFTAAQNAGIFNGSVLIVQKGNTLIDKGYGFKDVNAKTLNDKNTIYQIGSVTKQFTAVVILKLTEEGKLSLKDKLSKYFPSFQNGNKITIEHLLTHTSGIHNYTNDTSFMTQGWHKPAGQEMMMNLFKNKPLDFEPGSQFSYSNSGYLLLGYIIEKVTGKKYEKVVRDIIFTPLQMPHSGFDFIKLASPDKATGYYTISDTSGAKARIVDSSVSYAAGAIYSTTADLLKWNQSLTTAKIVTNKSLENAFTPRLAKYGFGFIIDSIQGQRLISHNGGVDGFVAHNTIIPADGLHLIILSNSMSSRLPDLYKAAFAILYNKPYAVPSAQKVLSLDSNQLKKYVGEYELVPNFVITIRFKGNQLTAQATGQGEAEIFPQKENFFFYKIVDAQIEFTLNEKGEVEKLILHQSGRDLPGKKIK